jgi:hypothetical protein
MKRIRQAVVGAALCLAWAAGAFPDAGSRMSLDEYRAELRRLSASIESLKADSRLATKVAVELPPQWTVEAEGKTFEIDNAWLKGKLQTFNKSPSDISQIQLHVVTLLADAEAFQRPARDVSHERAALGKILSRREFHNVHGPTAWDRLKRSILLFLLRLLEGTLAYSSFADVSRYFIWGLLAAAVIVLGFWVLRTLKKAAEIRTVLPDGEPVSAKRWPVWMAEAEAAAHQGRWREAVHLAYWTGISFLEERGTWRPDRARTPREYVLLLSPLSEYRGELSTLTRQFERIWYGREAAGPDSYAETLAHLERLGCRLT